MSKETIILPATEETWWYCKDCKNVFWDTVVAGICNNCNSDNIIRNKLLTVSEVVERLDVKHSAVYSYIESGKLKAHRLGGSGGKSRFSRYPYRVWEADLLEFIESGKFTLPKRKAGARRADIEPKDKMSGQDGRADLTPV